MFINKLLKPVYQPRGLYLKPLLVETSKGHRGGVVNYQKIKTQIIYACNNAKNDYVSTLFDLYRLPENFPGKSAAEYARLRGGHEKAVYLERCLSEDIGSRKLIANLMVHEFEALLFVQPECFRDEHLVTPKVIKQLLAEKANNAPEEINDGAETAPSKRIIKAFPPYKRGKLGYSSLIAPKIGLEAMRQTCPHFNGRLARFDELANLARYS
ncbi:DUF4276 family protein [Stenoxybacter acetivorans]|uniref:DUF4276 family protein n=1 Tax=Stenoxybacter acetivorans TaxID=422441 RepID=UPI000690B8E6|nr:DUF4276 family protein [Stenoxybacter acetivorans]